ILNIAIVVSEFNEEVTSRMLSVAEEKAKMMKLKINYTCKAPGAYDMPIIVDALLQTKHDEVIAHSTAHALTALSIKYQKPVSLGITGPGMQERHAYARIRPVAERAVESVVKIFNELQRIQK